MASTGGTSIDELERNVIMKMRSDDEPASLGELVEETSIQDREEAKNVMRRLINDGKVSTTPEWEYKLASRLRR